MYKKQKMGEKSIALNIGRNLVNLGVERLDEILGSYRSSFPPWGTYIYDTHTHTHTQV